MSRQPPIDEREFLQLVKNHGELCHGLRTLDLVAASGTVTAHAQFVGLCWLHLAREHLDDARAALTSQRTRSVYSRSYYAAYNASKATRYIVQGIVSLAGDDHRQASRLPEDFPDVDVWSGAIKNLYEHRLKADYDNWSATRSEMMMPPEKAVEYAEQFVRKAEQYLDQKFGIRA